jgi:hypothetical protein
MSPNVRLNGIQDVVELLKADAIPSLSLTDAEFLLEDRGKDLVFGMYASKCGTCFHLVNLLWRFKYVFTKVLMEGGCVDIRVHWEAVTSAVDDEFIRTHTGKEEEEGANRAASSRQRRKAPLCGPRSLFQG